MKELCPKCRGFALGYLHDCVEPGQPDSSARRHASMLRVLKGNRRDSLGRYETEDVLARVVLLEGLLGEASGELRNYTRTELGDQVTTVTDLIADIDRALLAAPGASDKGEGT